jgi:hypothetical protein
MATFGDIREAINQWVKNNLQPNGPTAFYQTRTTRTPGVVNPELSQGISAMYSPSGSGVEEVKKSGLDPAIQALLAESFKGSKGFITSQPWAKSSDMRHEQVHNVFDEGGLAKNLDSIVPKISSHTIDYLKNSPGYQQEAKNIGWPTVYGEEGTAIDLTDHRTWNEELISHISNLLSKSGKETQLKQLKELVK